MFIWHNRLNGDEQEMVEAGEQQAISDGQVEDIKHNLDYWRNYIEQT